MTGGFFIGLNVHDVIENNILVNIGYRTAVRNNESVKAPFLAEKVSEQFFVGRSGDAVYTVVAGHYALCMTVEDSIPELSRVIFTECCFIHVGASVVSVVLGTVECIVLGSGAGLKDIGIVTLHTLYIFYGKLSGEEGVLSEILIGSSVSGIPCQIDGGTPVI